MDKNMRALKDHTGIRSGKLTAISYLYTKKGKSFWLCKCDCGNECTARIDCVVRGTRKSCGCFNMWKYLLTERKFSHGLYLVPEYTVWEGMKSRCYNPKNIMYKSYGAKGIRVCERWVNNFEFFYVDMGCRPSSKHSIDRINNELDYSPENCRWATRSEQDRNLKRNVWIECDGERLILTDWAKKLKCTASKLYHRIKNKTILDFIRSHKNTAA